MSLESEVISILNSDYVKKLKPFSFGGVSYDPASDLVVVSHYIAFGDIRVQHKPKMKPAAAYLTGRDSIHLKHDTLTGLETQALVVHEAVHAWQDILKLGKLSAFAAEGAAYVVQMMFLLQQVPKGDRLLSKRSDVDRVYELAWSLAEKLMAGKKPTDKEYGALRDAIAAVSEYVAEDQDVGEYDGVATRIAFGPWPWL